MVSKKFGFFKYIYLSHDNDVMVFNSYFKSGGYRITTQCLTDKNSPIAITMLQNQKCGRKGSILYF